MLKHSLICLQNVLLYILTSVQFNRFTVLFLKICPIRQIILAYLK